MASKRKSPSSSSHPVDAYADKVVGGTICAGPWVRAACQRHLDDRKRKDIHFDTAAADYALEFFEEVLHLNAGKFEGKSFKLLPWEKFIIGSLFGWKAKDGYRRFRVAFIEVGKGNGKTPLAAGIGLYMLTNDQEWRAEVYAAAAKQDQAKVLFRDAVAMVHQSPALTERLHVSGGLNENNIAYLETGSFFRPISSERQGRGQSGPRPHCNLLDEVHEHPTHAMVEFLEAGTKFRKQPLTILITNSGVDRTSVCYSYHDYATKVVSAARRDDGFFGYVCAMDDGDDPLRDESCWRKANPSLGTTITKDYIRKRVTQARGMPSKASIVRRLNFCQWVDAEDAWIGQSEWQSVEADIDNSELLGRECFIGIDLSKKRDLTAMALVFPNEDGTYDAKVKFWTPGDTIAEREDAENVPYRTWRDKGYLQATPGKTVDYAWVAGDLSEMAGQYDIQAGAFDRWKIDDFTSELDDAGADIQLVPFGQGFQDMGPAVETLEEYILNGKLRVQYNPVLRWNAASVVLVENEAGWRKFHKRKATGHIDGIVALAMALATAEANVEEKTIERGVIAL